ncbi:MAG: DUF6537 domain-containing protein, partial [Kordiimonas sp.]
VARLHTDGSFEAELQKTFSGDFKVKYHMAPPIFGATNGPLGRPKKYEFGGWMKLALKAMRGMRFLRGTAFDVFGMTVERKAQRQMITDYEKLVEEVMANLNAQNYVAATEVLSAVQSVRGYGPVFEEALETYTQDLPAKLEAYMDNADKHIAA